MSVTPPDVDRIDRSIKMMWDGCINSRFDNGDCLEWAVAIHGVLMGSEIHFIFEPPASFSEKSELVKSHFLVKNNTAYYDHRGIHTRESWNWNQATTIIQRVTPDIIRAITHGGSISIPGYPIFMRHEPFDEVLCGLIAQEFLLKYQPPVPSISIGISVNGPDVANW